VLLTILGLVVLFVVVLLAVASTRPDVFQIQRSITINAPPDKVFPHINDFRKWDSWSPWEKMDPNLQRTHSGEPSGKGAVYAWEGNSNVGSGRMEILESQPPSRILIKLDFLKPFEAHNQAEFKMDGSGPTNVIWTMTGPQAFPMKVMGVFMSMDSMVGKDFEKGLGSLKAVAEGS
jgi:uncharacterized protein YndB with AHSA1/START domain